MDPSAGPVQRFAFELRKLRAEAGGITYRGMAQQAGYSVTTLSQAAAGEQLPTLPVVLAYVRACGGDRETWEARWRAAVEDSATRPAADEDGVDAPYRGLARFETGDSGRFFGRERLTADLLDLLGRRRFAAVFGPSGSGKSSLLRAGLVPALQHPQEPGLRLAAIRILTPGSRPAHTHADLLARTGTPSGGALDTLLIVDQFEETFTLCHDPAERARFIDLLLTARGPGSRSRVLLTVRADFYGHCAGHRELAEALRDAHLLVGPMSTAELREAIVRPATADGLTVERALTSRLVEEVADAPGGLPLLSHVLLETWRRRRGKTLTTAGYEAAGGLNGSIAQTAEDLFAQFSADQTAIARRLLLRLIIPGDGVPDTGRPADRTELHADTPGPERDLLERLVRARLVTLNDGVVELAHTALITAWPRLYAWIEEDRERLRVHRRLTEAAAAWEELGREDEALYRGSRLDSAEEAFGPDEHHHLTVLEREFLVRSTAQRDREQQAAARTTRRLRSLVTALSVLLVMTLAAAGLTFSQRQDLLAQRRTILAGHLAAQSSALRTKNFDLAALLAVQAYETSPTKEATAAVYAIGASPLQRTIRLHGRHIADSVVFSPDGRTVAAYGYSSASRLQLLEVATGRRRVEFPGLAAVRSAFFSRNGKRILTVDGGPSDDRRQASVGNTKTGAVRTTFVAEFPVAALVSAARNRTLVVDYDGGTWDMVTGRHLSTLSEYSPFQGHPPVSPDGHRLVAIDRAGTVRTWSLDEGRRPTHTFTVAGFDADQPSAISADGRTLAVATPSGSVEVWDVAAGHRRTTLTSQGADVTDVSLSRDGRSLAAADSGHTVRVWNTVTSTMQAGLIGHLGAVTSMAFSPDGHTLATVSHQDATVRIWDLAPSARKSFPLSGGRVDSTALSPDGRLLAIAHDAITPRSVTSTVQLWDLVTNRRRILSTGPYRALLAFAPDSHTLLEQGWPRTHKVLYDTTSRKSKRSLPTDGALATAFSPGGHTFAQVNLDGRTTVWNMRTGAREANLASSAQLASSIAISPDGRLLAIAKGGTTRVWNTHTGSIERELTMQDEPVPGSASLVAFSPDGRTLATSNKNTVRLWDADGGQLKEELSTTATTMTFSPDSRTLATAASNGDIVLWDTSTGSERRTLTAGDAVAALAFSPDCRTLTAEQRVDHSVLTWHIVLPDPTAVLDGIRRAVGRDLTPTERQRYLSASASG